MITIRSLLRAVLLASFAAWIAPAVFAQAPVISAALNQLGKTTISPGDSVILYGSLPADAARNQSVTVGGKPGTVNVVLINRNVTESITIFVPFEAPLGPATIVLSHLGVPSNAFPVNITPLDPILPLDPYGAFLHNQSGVNVTPALPATPGEGVTVFVTALGPTNPPLATGAPISTFAATVAPVTVNLGGRTVTPDFAGHYPYTQPLGFEGNYQLSFTVPPDMPRGPQTVTFTIGGITSNPQTLWVGTQAFSNLPTITSVTNGANFSATGPYSAGSFVSIFGTGFGTQDNLSAFPATQVNGVSVLFNGVPAPIFALIASAGQLNTVLPAEVPANGSVTVVVQNLNGPSRTFSIKVAAVSPGIFILADPSNSARRNAAALIANTAWIVMPASEAKAYGLPSCAGLAVIATCGQPARPGDFFQLYATGLGIATPNGDTSGVVLATGQPAPANGSPVYLTVGKPTVTIGGKSAQLLFSGLAPGFAGLYQVNVQIPAGIGPNDSVPIQITMPGGASDSATIAISQ